MEGFSLCIFRDILKYGEITHSLEDKSSYISFNSSDEASKWGHLTYDNWSKEYKKASFMAQQIMNGHSSLPFSSLECYCGYLYGGINSYLRSTPDVYDISMSRELANNLVFVLSSAPRIPNNIIVYRMVCDEFMNYLIDQNKKGFFAIEKGFMSSSMLEPVSSQDEPYALHNNILKIHVPQKTVGVYVNSVTRRSEQEILIVPNRYIAMIDYPKKHPTGKLITECKLVNWETDLQVN